jgi:hypothetical protein
MATMKAGGVASACSLIAAMLAGVPQARSRAALWCVPALAENVTRLAEACGHPVPPEATRRVQRMSEASSAAVERVEGAEFARRWRPEYLRLSTPAPPAVTPERCAAQLPRFKEFLDEISDPGKGEEMVRRIEREAAATTDPITGLCL